MDVFSVPDFPSDSTAPTTSRDTKTPNGEPASALIPVLLPKGSALSPLMGFPVSYSLYGLVLEDLCWQEVARSMNTPTKPFTLTVVPLYLCVNTALGVQNRASSPFTNRYPEFWRSPSAQIAYSAARKFWCLPFIPSW